MPSHPILTTSDLMERERESMPQVRERSQVPYNNSPPGELKTVRLNGKQTERENLCFRGE